ncbi:malonyl-coenzyme:anthocyanin 5-O-glucoside-6'''-O-malonyltransferase-like [Sesamum indicum]|uniref:Malonyl-coenzyme:anthocyanin 5-O-glucoside-6'''-O-malonyltransferase-like n=1 Tax=Sesamum indicum TaxID=4182 RepID=A0A6I9U309_SESIN|nr:malonyl-coenzyme:anthocyanin 5-O-glucoside-6'''-O-malonyltransferase-like [Sesamum indicum]
MATTIKRVTVQECCNIAPPTAAGDEAEQSLPLTFFDILWLYIHPTQRLLFYQFPCSAKDFLETIVPSLKKSLSRTLGNYLPLAGNLLIHPSNSGMPEFRYSPGDSVSVTFAEWSENFDFDYLTGNQARNSDMFYALVPVLPEPRVESESAFKIIPLLAIQATLFPETGICIGITNHHAVGDASSIVGFIKAWSRAAKLGENQQLSAENQSLPFFDRSVIKDPSGRANLFWNQMRLFQVGSSYLEFPTNKVRATYVLQNNDIHILKNLALAREPGLPHLSSFTVTTGYVWACLVKSAAEAGEEVDDDEPEYFGFAVDARHRLEPPVPATYFGNCLAFVVTESTHRLLRGSAGFVVAVKLIGELISQKVNNKEEILRDADDWIVKYGSPLLGKRTLGVVGSPKFDLYDADFGWGKPNKYESMSTDRYGSMSVCKSREFEGGLEIGLSLPRKKMDAFAAIFSDGLKTSTSQ